MSSETVSGFKIWPNNYVDKLKQHASTRSVWITWIITK